MYIPWGGTMNLFYHWIVGSLTAFALFLHFLTSFKIINYWDLLAETHWLNCPPWPGTVVTICKGCFMTGGPGKEQELISHHQLVEFRKSPKETPCVWAPPRILLAGIHLGWAMRVPPGRTLESKQLVRDNLETNPVTIEPETGSCDRAVLLGSLTYCSLPGVPFPINSLALSASISSDDSFPSVRQEPHLGPGKGLPSCNRLCEEQVLWPGLDHKMT